MSRPLYDERLRAPLSWWVVVLLLVTLGVFEISAGFTYVVYVPVTVFLVGFFVVPLLLTSLSRVRVHDGVLTAGGESVRASEITSIQALDRAATRLQLGPRADPAAHLVTRGWIPCAVLIRLSNPRPTPYWLVSSRHPDDLVTALRQARQETKSPRP